MELWYTDEHTKDVRFSMKATVQALFALMRLTNSLSSEKTLDTPKMSPGENRLRSTLRSLSAESTMALPFNIIPILRSSVCGSQMDSDGA